MLVGSAFALGWLPGSPAPKDVKNEISRLTRMTNQAKEILALQEHPPGPPLLIGKTNLLASVSTPSTRYVVWVVPRADGERCAFLQGIGERSFSSFGCSARTPKLFPATFSGGGITLIGGFAPVGTRTVGVRGALGWGSKTLAVHRGFYFGQAPGPLALKVIARDADRRVLARYTWKDESPPPERPIVPTDRTALTITTDSGRRISLVVGPGEGGTCVTWTGDVALGQADCGPFAKRGLQTSLGHLRLAGKSFVYLEGQTGPQIHAVRVRFEDGTTVPVKFGLRVFLYEVQPRNYVKGHRPQVVLGLDRDGQVIARSRLGPYAR
jgi:hypothetical protein